MKSARWALPMLLVLACGGSESGKPGTGTGATGVPPGTEPGQGVPGTPGVPGAPGVPGVGGTCADGTGTAAEETLLWKRGAALAADLGNALALSETELCTEVSDIPCTEVHRAPLGRADPFGTGLLEPVQSPLATTALATDRLALSACSARVDKDSAGSPAVFQGVPLGDQPLAADAVARRTTAEQLATLLYTRMLARRPTSPEVDVLAELAVGNDGAPVSARSFAKLACFAVATTSEFVLY
jgi:hypothetical protein